MKSAVLTQVGKIEVQELPMPKPGPGEVLLKVFACGICGTDVHIFEGDKGAADNPLPIVLGHEFAGTIEQLGEGISGFGVGDKVCVDPNVLCGHCYYCQNGIGHFCENMVGIGTTVNGGFSQYCAVPFQQLYRLGERTSFEAGAMGEPLSCCLHGIDMCDIQVGDTAVVIGGGMIGLLMMQLARQHGATRLVLVEPVAEKRAMGKTLGADLCIDPTAGDIAAVLSENGIHRVNVVIECVGKPATIRQAITLAGKGATVMMFGLTKPEEAVDILPYEIFKKEIALKSSFINPYTHSRAAGLINAGRVDVTSMVAQVIPPEELGRVLASAELRSRGKYIVAPWQEPKGV